MNRPESEPFPCGAFRSPSILTDEVVKLPVRPELVNWIRGCWEGGVAHDDGASRHSNPYPPVADAEYRNSAKSGWYWGWLAAHERWLSRGGPTPICGCVRDHT